MNICCPSVPWDLRKDSIVSFFSRAEAFIRTGSLSAKNTHSSDQLAASLAEHREENRKGSPGCMKESQ